MATKVNNYAKSQGGVLLPARAVMPSRSRPRAGWLRDNAAGTLRQRVTFLRESRDDIRRSWSRAASLAMDFIQNSARLKGAVDQVLADTVGTGLKLQYKPDLSRLGYSATEQTEFIKLVEKRWREWSNNPAECDLRGKFTVDQMVDISLRWYMAYGETTGYIDYLKPGQRRRYGIESGTKICMIPPHRLVQDTVTYESLFHGVIHDENGRPVQYRVRENSDGIKKTVDYPARDRQGRQLFIHVFEPKDATDVRGISELAPALQMWSQAERLDDATLSTAILQTVFAAVLTSKEPSEAAFNAIEALPEEYAEIGEEFYEYFSSRLDAARDGGLHIDGSPQVSHLAPGEDLSFRTASTPGSEYLPFSKDLKRGMARCIGVTYGSFTMDQSEATYSSVRMDNATLWPVVGRRRDRIASPVKRQVFNIWLDEEIGEGRIPLKGGYAAYRANKSTVLKTTWQGPPPPSADDHKSARAASERLQNGTSTLAYECQALGLDVDDVIETRKQESQTLAEAGLPNPFKRMSGGKGDDDEDEDDKPVKDNKENSNAGN